LFVDIVAVVSQCRESKSLGVSAPIIRGGPRLWSGVWGPSRCPLQWYDT